MNYLLKLVVKNVMFKPRKIESEEYEIPISKRKKRTKKASEQETLIEALYMDKITSGTNEEVE